MVVLAKINDQAIANFLRLSYFPQVLMNYFWFGDNLKDAVSKPRLHSQLFPNMVLVEPNFSKRFIKGLKRYGHKHITNDTTLFTGEKRSVSLNVIPTIY